MRRLLDRPAARPLPDGPLPGPANTPFAPALALSVTLAFGVFLALMSFVWLVHPPGRLPGFFAAAGDQNQGTKTALYAVAFALLLPAALVAGPRLARTISRGPNGGALLPLAALIAGGLAAALLLVKLSGLLPWGDGMGVVLALVVCWAGATAVALLRAARPQPWPALSALAKRSSAVYIGAGVLVFAALLCTASFRHANVPVLVVGALAVAAVAALGRERLHLPRPSRRVGVAIDVVAGLVLVLAIPDLVIFTLNGELPNLLNANGVERFHQNFLLGPVNQVLGGGTLLVNEPPSQWGVGSVYFVAAWFHIAPIGYGTYGMLDGILNSLLFLGLYTVVRVAGASRLVAIAALAAGVVVLVYNRRYPVGGLPQQGPLRFGLPLAAIVPLVLGSRWPRWERLARAAALLALAISAVWALEAFAYTLFTYAATVCLQAWLRAPGDRLRWLRGQALLALGACVGAHLLFALATLAASGHLPRWSEYGAFVHAFLLGGAAGNITYGFARWSPGVAVAAGYLASAAAIVLLAWLRPAVAQRERVALVALTGATAWGVALFSYFDNRSATYLLLYVAPPALMLAPIWLGLVLRSAPVRAMRSAALAFVLSLAVVVVAIAAPSVSHAFPRTPLVRALPGGAGLRASLHRLWHLPPIDPRASRGEALVKRYMPGQKHILIVMNPDLGIEIMLRSGRANTLPIGDSYEDTFVASSRLPQLRKAIARLSPGERMLVDGPSLLALERIRSNAAAAAHPLKEFAVSPLTDALQGWVLAQLNARFRLVTIDRDPAGFFVLELRRR